MANKLKEYSGDAIWAAVEYDEPKCFFNKKFYLKEDADKVIAELTNKLNNARANRETGKLAQPKPPKILDTFAAGKCCELVGSTPYFARYKTK